MVTFAKSPFSTAIRLRMCRRELPAVMILGDPRLGLLRLAGVSDLFSPAQEIPATENCNGGYADEEILRRPAADRSRNH